MNTTLHSVSRFYTYATEEYHFNCTCGWIRYGKNLKALAKITDRHLLEPDMKFDYALYSLTSARGGGFFITKFDQDGEEELSHYLMPSETTCTCPQGHRPTCRHRQMFSTLYPNIDSSARFCYDTSEWVVSEEAP